MTETQIVHISMLNSYNLITGRATLDQIIESGVSFFAHVPDEDITEHALELLTWYFQEHEMFEKCAELKKLQADMFNEDGTIKLVLCECDYPIINLYTKKLRCGRCKNLIKK